MVLEITGYGEYCVSISCENSVKLCSLDGSVEPVGGGSLRKRLGETKLVTLDVDEKANKVFFGTSVNRVLIYKLEGFQFEYLTSITTVNCGPVSCLTVSYG